MVNELSRYHNEIAFVLGKQFDTEVALKLLVSFPVWYTHFAERE